MALVVPKVRKHLSADALFRLLRMGFSDIAEPRQGTPDIPLADALMSAFAVFTLKARQPGTYNVAIGSGIKAAVRVDALR